MRINFFLRFALMFLFLSQNVLAEADTITTSPDSPAVSVDDDTTDIIGTSQSSTITSECINVEGRGILCGDSAVSYCNLNTNTVECRNFNRMDSTSLDDESIGPNTPSPAD